MILGLLIALWLAPAQGTGAMHNVGPQKVGTVSLRLECQPSSLRVIIANTGSVDTTLSVGTDYDNGFKYMIGNLKLFVRVPGQALEEFQYGPHDYPGAIVGRLDEWLQPLPASSEFAVIGRPADFYGINWPGEFRRGSEMHLTLVIPEPNPKYLLLKYWSGTLISNVCVVP